MITSFAASTVLQTNVEPKTYSIALCNKQLSLHKFAMMNLKHQKILHLVNQNIRKKLKQREVYSANSIIIKKQQLEQL